MIYFLVFEVTPQTQGHRTDYQINWSNFPSVINYKLSANLDYYVLNFFLWEEICLVKWKAEYQK